MSDKKEPKKFVPGSRSSSDLPENDEQNIKIKKVSATEAPVNNGSNQGEGGPKVPSYNFTGVAPGKMYVHPPSRLINGRVMYSCRYLGHLRVPDPRGSGIVHDAIDKLLAVAAVNRANLEEDTLAVDLSISIRSLATVDRHTKKSIHQHPLHLISFSADDKRDKGNMFAYICRGKPPATDHICYVYQCSASQAKEITTTVGQAFELAYKKFLETKQAQEDFKRLKEMLKTASPEQKVEIQKKLIEVNKIRAAEYERQKKIAAIQARMTDPNIKPSITQPLTKINVQGTKGGGLYTGSGKDSAAMFEGSKSANPELQGEELEGVQREVKHLEIESERQLQTKKTEKNSSSVESKWENITMALEPFQMEPSMDPGMQYLVKRIETKELDSAIGDIEEQIRDLEDAFDWRRRKGQGPVPSLYDDIEEEATDSAEDALKMLETIEGDLGKAKATAEDMDMEIPELPANYVMDEFIKAKEKAAMPKPGTVKDKAGQWYKEHHD